MTLAARLADLRKKKSQSLQDVADAVGASKAHVWQIETGRAQNPSIELIRRLADHFGVSVSWLLGEVPSTQNEQEVALYRAIQGLSSQNKQIIQTIIDGMRKVTGDSNQ